MATPFSFEIVTPDKMLFASEEVTYVGFRALSGNLGLKARHMPIIATMDIAPMKLEFTDGSVKEFAVCGGFLEMKDNKCTVLATIAEADADIDTARATAAKERAEQRLASKSEDIDTVRAGKRAEESCCPLAYYSQAVISIATMPKKLPPSVRAGFLYARKTNFPCCLLILSISRLQVTVL